MNNRLAVGFGLLLGLACRDQAPPSSASNPPTTSAPPPATTSAPPPSTTSSARPAPSPTPPNRPPTVRVTGDDGCHPRRVADVVTPCTVSFRAEASDPDGDSLTFRWSGCASGSDNTATCTIDSLATVTATVRVTDGKDGSASASKTARGTNRRPEPGYFYCGYRPSQNPGAPDCGLETCEPPLPTNGLGYCIDGSFNARDTEGDLVYCGPVTARGACTGKPGIYECGGIEDAFSFEFRTGPEAGDCVLTIEMHDSWGATASTTARVPVHPLP